MKRAILKNFNKIIRFYSERSNIPLSQCPPHILNQKYSDNLNLTAETKITKLSNGLTVASDNRAGHFCTVGIIVDSGARYEVAYPKGLNHMLEKLSFNSTNNYKDKDHILREFEKQCAIFDCQTSRDNIIYAASTFTPGLEKVLDILSEVVLQPHFTSKELITARKTITYELEDLGMKPDQEPILMELIHSAAYRDNTLGFPKLSPLENLANFDKNLLYTYMKDHFAPNRIVITAVGINHDILVEMIDKTFNKKIPIWYETQNSNLISPGIDKSISQYTGGVKRKEKDMSKISLGPNPLPELAHVVIGLESIPHGHPQFVAGCVLNSLMGGGGSFSAGGPGKGMYSRLYLNVLNVHHWIFNATAYNHSYKDSGLFCIHASAHPTQLSELTDVIVKELSNMSKNITKSELDRAKKQLQSMLMMNLESRPVVFEDIGRQVLATGTRKLPEQLLQEISEIKEEDIVNMAKRLLSTKPSVGALGSLKALPTYQQIHQGLLDSSNKYVSHNSSRYGSIFG